MDKARWNPLKSIYLKQTRGVSFEEIINSKFIGSVDHPARMHQKILIYEHKQYYWAVPCVVNKSGVYLKTLYPSRKLKKIYEKGAAYEKDKVN